MLLPNEIFIDCKRHGKTIARLINQTGRRKLRIRCKICAKEANAVYKRRKEGIKVEETEKKCTPFFCVLIDRYHQVNCSLCEGKWAEVQMKYLEAFKPKEYQWRWNQI
jgi:hypothetical protein